jgi:hypothetical protein
LRFLISWQRPCRVGVIGVTLAMAAAVGFASPALAGPTTASGGVSSAPASGTPQLLAPTKTEQNVRQIVQCGSTMYAVGTFTTVKQKGVTHQVNNVISFSATSPFRLTGWAPDVNGTVNSIAFVGGNCADAYLGGNFTSINGATVRDIAEVDTTTGQVVSSFGHSASAQVETLLGYHGHLIAGGSFTSINGSKADAYMASLNPVTGKNGKFPLTGLCDAAAAFPATQAKVLHKWINIFGCDSAYSVAADSSAVYVGGHQRWSQNQNGCNHRGRGASVFDPGLQGLSPGTGKLELNSSGSPLYSMSRANADDMLLTTAGLWIASSNRFGSVKCGGVGAHSGICFLPYG